MTRPQLHHWYHVYAAGNWPQAVTEHCDALVRFGLYDHLDSLHVGFVGTDGQVDAVRSTLDVLVPRWTECGRAETGWEQVTLEPMYRFVQDHDGLVSYCHTKGASRADPIDPPWRRAMTYHNVVDWRRPVVALMFGKYIAGCHWHESQHAPPKAIPGYGNGGMYGGNFWWTHAELLRQNVPPSIASRMHAEHWLGQLSEVMPITAETIEDLHPGMIHDLASVPAW